MSGHQNMDQAAGNDWTNPVHVMPHEFITADSTRDIEFSYANSMFQDLESRRRTDEVKFQENLGLLREKYVFKDPAAIEFFIRNHRMVVPLLIEASSHLAVAFHNRAPLALEIMPDEETPHSIYVLAVWNFDADDARAALRTFDESWLLGNLQFINGRIVFDYELV